jgi:hypothetical protein
MLALGLVFSQPQPAFADRGSIPWGNWDAQNMPEIFEPAQNAIIAWNGKEEILLLSTDLKASKPTKVLEVLPLPSEPAVTRGDIATFAKINTLINDELRQNWFGGKGPGDTRAASGAAEVTFHEKIGAHDIRVVHVLESSEFEQWIRDFFKKEGTGPQQISPVLLATIEQYLLDGYHWFVFDVVELGLQLKSNDAIQYRFATDRFYYPMRISATDSGETNIRLVALTERGLSRYIGLPQESIRQVHRKLKVDTVRIVDINQEMGSLFRSETINLQTLRIQGNLKSFDLDVLAR